MIIVGFSLTILTILSSSFSASGRMLLFYPDHNRWNSIPIFSPGHFPGPGWLSDHLFFLKQRYIRLNNILLNKGADRAGTSRYFYFLTINLKFFFASAKKKYAPSVLVVMVSRTAALSFCNVINVLGMGLPSLFFAIPSILLLKSSFKR